MVNIKCHKIRFILVICIAIVILFLGGFYIYTLNYYQGDDISIQTISQMRDISKIKEEDNLTVFLPIENEKEDIGIIFYPGGKVEDRSYAPLMSKLSEKGFTCFLVKMPFNLAVFDINAANDIIEKYQDIKHWFISGHSLGGAMASSYVKDNYNKIDGLILLGAYPTNEIDIPTIILYGSDDRILNREKIKDSVDVTVIDGGNHSYFGNYGEQKGDGQGKINNNQQQDITVNEIINFISIN